MRVACLLSCLLLLPLAAHAGEGRTADAVTEPGRGLDRALDVVLAGTAGKRTIVFLVDPTASLKNAGFVAAFERACVRNRERLTDALIGVAAVGAKKDLVQAPTADVAVAGRAIAQILATPTPVLPERVRRRPQGDGRVSWADRCP